MTGRTRDEYAIAYSTSRPLEAILRLRIDTGARLKTFGATKRMACSIAIGRAIRRRALLVSRNYALRRYRKPRTIGAAEEDGGGDCRGYHLRWPSPVHRNPCLGHLCRPRPFKERRSMNQVAPPRLSHMVPKRSPARGPCGRRRGLDENYMGTGETGNDRLRL